jgi:hypothetical protein
MKTCGTMEVVQLHSFLTSALDGGEWSHLWPSNFIPGAVAPGTHCIHGWVGPRADIHTEAKRESFRPCREPNCGRLSPD